MSLRNKIGEKIFGNDVVEIVNQIMSFLKQGDTVIDLGAGTCLFTKLLREKGYVVTPVDIVNRSYYVNINSIIYDGQHLPFNDNKFNTCILIAVLHHTRNPEAVLKEAVRVSKKIVIYEDVITNVFQRYYTYFVDSVLNKELIAHHSNKTDFEWQELFNNLGLKIVRKEYKKSWLFLSNPLYFLEK